jgi:hypothetical protein
MFSKLFKININKIGFEDMKFAVDTHILIINTLLSSEQGCLIQNTLQIEKEEHVINDLIEKCEFNKKIIIYGKNSCDETVENKYYQLVKLGFFNTYIYTGGLFEWLLLQDIYGKKEFMTTTNELDILKYKPCSKIIIT